MELNEFVAHIAEQFEETEVSLFTPQTHFRELEEYSSLIALSIISVIDMEYDVALKGADIRSAVTIEDLFNIVKGKM